MTPCNMFAFTLRCTENCFGWLLGLVQSDCSFGWTACRRCLRGLRRKNSEPPHTCLLHGFGCLCDGIRDHGLAAIFLQRACLLSSLAGKIALRMNHSCPNLIHLALFLSTFFLITMSSVFTSDNGPGGDLATCAAFWSVSSESSTQLRKLIGCRPRSPPRLLKYRPSCLPLFALKRGLYTRHAGLDLTCGLVCCSIPALRLHWLSRLVLRRTRL